MFILEHAAQDWALVETQVMATLRQHFKPEFLNRVDDVIIFKPLGREHIEYIVDLQLARLRTLLGDRKIVLRLSDAAKKLVSDEGYDPSYGARPLKRAIQRLLQNPLALAILQGKFADGDTILVDVNDANALRFEKGDAAVPEPNEALAT